ncbi:hypothetical protein MAXJ12_30722 [Mesorhizobium alhagi CCNWXJ12-2]|uniref:Uncharacterized protein n=1 Tax=Mesorhizobium alhagi CCNWXJ12-2 TaxID=1107882 RepID=H0I107_9HYPH|nr:hypothetical protein MAXJ12_30722 [Mesorhizobium alhagi CCNWXJ12-2]
MVAVLRHKFPKPISTIGRENHRFGCSDDAFIDLPHLVACDVSAFVPELRESEVRLFLAVSLHEKGIYTDCYIWRQWDELSGEASIGGILYDRVGSM